MFKESGKKTGVLNQMRFYLMSKKIITSNNPFCKTCGEQIREGDLVATATNKNKTIFRHKDCWEKTFVEC